MHKLCEFILEISQLIECVAWYFSTFGVFREAVEFLSSEGHIYSTIDDEHYKSTDSGDWG